MAILAGWLSKQAIPEAVIEERLLRMAAVLEQHGGERALVLQPGAGLVTFADPLTGVTTQQKTALLDWLPGQQTFVYRRPLTGWHPLYYVQDWPEPGDLLFASEIKALLAAGVPCRLFLPALEAVRRYGFLPAPWTAFVGIEVVPAGSLLRWQQGRTLVSELHDYRLAASASEGEEGEATPDAVKAALRELDELLCAQSRHLLPLPAAPLLVLTAGTGAAAMSAELLSWVAQQQRQESSPSLQIATLAFAGQRRAYTSAEALAERLQAGLLAIRGVDAPEYWLATVSAIEAPCALTFPLALHQALHTAGVESDARLALLGLGARPLLAPPPSPSLAGEESVELFHSYSALLHGRSSRPRFPITEGDQLWAPEVRRCLAESPSWEETRHARRLARKTLALRQPWQRWRYLDLHLRLPDLLLQTAQQLATFDRLILVAPFALPELAEALALLPPDHEHLISQATPGNQPSPLSLASLVQSYRRSSAETAWPATTLLSAPARSLVAELTSTTALSSIGRDLLAETLTPTALLQTGIFAPKSVKALQERSRGGSVPRELVLVFTTQLLCKLFGATL
ncbi:hypothetical protein KTAU_00770 [Thermogemmatispora aurantia]|uniref:Uncharacterized protein n=1 Tax=Thermogemmatispora aurantia TaxID=2045279 RepID=A0A5J4JTX8_9CHLR|nr:hypothetical protein [Thermogemmatispora aurantia]GER81438.1 hypothetical protein KTAU_00770 [Thermogemmatispora aurantia]